MRKLFITGLFSLFVTLSLSAQGKVNPNYHYVKPHYRNGTYIEGHFRTNRNSTNRDNYSTLGNINPHTLQMGTILPDNNPGPSYEIPSYTPSTYSLPNTYASGWNLNTAPSSISNSSSTWISDFSNSSFTKKNSSYSNSTYPTYSAPDYSAGERTINYTNGRDEFNVAAPTKVTFQKNLTYYSFDPFDYELKENIGWAEGKLLLDGPYRFYDDKGRLRNIENYRKGLKHGKARTYDENGVVTLEAEYTLGRLTYQKFTTEDGVTFEAFGELKKPGTRIMLYQDGALYKRIEMIGNGQDKHIVFNPETQAKEVEYSLLENELHGTLRRYKADGQTLDEVANYKYGLLDGESRVYGENGKMKERFLYKADKKSGPFEIYNDAGILTMKGSLLDDSLHGEVLHYDQTGAIEYILNYDQGQLDGPYKVFDRGKVAISGSYTQDKKHGLWNYYWLDSSSYYLAQWFNFQNGVLHGAFREIRKDSILVGTYKNGVLDGDFRAYQPFSLWLLGKPPKNLNEDEILCSGRYWKGKKDGHWKFYSRTGVLLSEGNFLDDIETGEWRYYLERFADGKGNDLPFAGQIYLIENYLNGKKNGRSERFAYLRQTPVMCDTSIGTVNPFDTCFQLQFQKVHELTYYKNDELHGPIEWRDADGKVVKKGEFRNGLRSGRWTEIQADPTDSTEIYRYEGEYSEGQLNGYFKKYNATNDVLLTDGYIENSQKSGIWKEFFPDGKKVNTMTVYANGKRVSEKDYNYDGDLWLFANYKDGFMTKIEEYDTVQNRLKRRFDVHSFTDGKYVIDYTVVGDTTVTMRLEYSAGYREPENTPGFFVFGFDLINKLNEESVKLEGPSVMKRRDGKVLAEGPFHNNLRHGEWKNYFHDQNILQLVQFEANEKKTERYLEMDSLKPFSGKLTLLTPNEGSYLVIKIKKGLRHGPTFKYDQTGKLVKKTMYKAGQKQE